MFTPTILSFVNLIDKSIDVINVYHESLLRGTINTLLVAFAGTIIGLIIGLFIGAIRFVCNQKERKESKIMKIIKRLCYYLTSIYVEVMRGTPMMVQAMFLYWFLKSTINWTAFTAAIVIISINTGAYMAEIVRSGIQSVDQGQNEGARSIGMSNLQAMFYVILPQAIKNSFPSIGNEFIVNIKDSCVLNCIGFAELFFQAKSIAGSTFDYTGAFFVVAIIYFILTFTTSRMLKVIEDKMNYIAPNVTTLNKPHNSLPRRVK